MYGVSDIAWGVNKDGKISDCMEIFHEDCTDCIFNGKRCTQERLKWLQQECKKPEVDWTKVEIDTPILVRNFKDDGWEIRYFAGLIGGKVHTFDKNEASDDYTNILPWRYAKLVDRMC